MRFIRTVKLEQLCLHVIVENLEKLISVRNVPQKHIDFLLRVYSKEVFKRFSHDRSISEESMLWFLNRHSRKIYLPTISEIITKQLQMIGSTITYLSLKESLATENMINSILCCVPNVTKLDLSFTCCSDKTMLCIQKMCPEIVSLNLNYCPVTSEGMVNLCGSNQSLRNLNLKGTSVIHTGISVVLKGMPKLERLTFFHIAEIFYQIHKVDLDRKGICYNLTELIYDDLGNSDVLEVLRTWTFLCPNITKVAIAFGVTYKELQMCSEFKKLQHLKIVCPCEKGAAAYFMPMDKVQRKDNGHLCTVLAPFAPRANRLTTLILTLTEIPAKLLMENFKNLKTLCLQNVTFTDFLEEDIKPNKEKLEQLVLKEIPLTNPSTFKAILLLISASKNVTRFHLTCLKVIPPETFDVILSSMEDLSVADFSFTPIDGSSALRFFRLPSMKTLFLDGCWNISSYEDFRGIVSQEPASTVSWSILMDDCQSDDSDDNDSFQRLLVTTLDGYVLHLKKRNKHSSYNGHLEY